MAEFKIDRCSHCGKTTALKNGTCADCEGKTINWVDDIFGNASYMGNALSGLKDILNKKRNNSS